MSLTITHAGTTQTRTGVGQRTGGKIIRVLPVVIAGTTHNNDVMFANIEIENAVEFAGGCSKLSAIYVLDVDNEGHNMDLVFMQKNTALGTVDSGPNISDPNAKAANICGVISLDFTDRQCSLGGSNLTGFSDGAAGTMPNIPMLLQAEPGSTSVYLGGIAREEIDFDAITDLQIILHIEYL
tara:strand:- start:1699 stop:2244 length:546 start_codon:yes stop_codon:yes gene_type:complete